MKKLVNVIFVMVMVFGYQASAHAFFINFENGTEGGTVTDITGVSFQSFNGYNPLYADIRTGFYNATSDDLSYGTGSYHMNGYISVWAGLNADARGVKVDFTNNDGTWFRTGYASFSNFYLEAHYTDGSSATVTGSPDLNGPMQFLDIAAPTGNFIDYIVLHDTGNFWIVDDMSGDASGVSNGVSSVPEPSTLILLAAGLLGVGSLRKKFTWLSKSEI